MSALYVLAGYDAQTEARFSKLQQSLFDRGFTGRQTPNLPQHVTLASFPLEAEAELVERVQKVAQETRPFALTFNHIGVFQGGQVLFLAPDTNCELLSLKELFGDSHGWTAHTTMLIDEPETVLQAASVLLNEFSACEGKLNSLHLYEFFPARHILSVNFTEKEV